MVHDLFKITGVVVVVAIVLSLLYSASNIGDLSIVLFIRLPRFICQDTITFIYYNTPVDCVNRSLLSNESDNK